MGTALGQMSSLIWSKISDKVMTGFFSGAFGQIFKPLSWETFSRDELYMQLSLVGVYAASPCCIISNESA